MNPTHSANHLLDLLNTLLFSSSVAVGVYLLLRIRPRKAIHSPDRSDSKPTLHRLVRAIIVVIFFFLSAELYPSIFEPLKDKSTAEYPPSSIMFNPELSYCFKKNWSGMWFDIYLETNSQGLRSPEIPFRKEPGEFRILCIGDSVTFGARTNYDATYPAYLQEELRRRYPDKKITVINGGHVGYTTFQGIMLLEEVGLKYYPDLIVSAFLYNDRRSGLLTSYRNRNKKILFIKRLLYRSHLYVLLRHNFFNLARKFARDIPKQPSSDARRLKSFSENLETLAEIAGRHGATMIFVNLPYNKSMSQNGAYLKPSHILNLNFEAFREEIRRVAVERGVYYIDVKKYFDECSAEEHSVLFARGDDIHLAPRGHGLFARIVASYIDEKKLIP